MYSGRFGAIVMRRNATGTPRGTLSQQVLLCVKVDVIVCIQSLFVPLLYY